VAFHLLAEDNARRNQYLAASRAQAELIRSALVSFSAETHNDSMNVSGRVHNGVIILEGGVTLPEGAVVTVSYAGTLASNREKRRIQVPLVRSERPGSVSLTGERIAEILNEEDASPRR
jgi:hypothetical protein